MRLILLILPLALAGCFQNGDPTRRLEDGWRFHPGDLPVGGSSLLAIPTGRKCDPGWGRIESTVNPPGKTDGAIIWLCHDLPEGVKNGDLVYIDHAFFFVQVFQNGKSIYGPDLSVSQIFRGMPFHIFALSDTEHPLYFRVRSEWRRRAGLGEIRIGSLPDIISHIMRRQPDLPVVGFLLLAVSLFTLLLGAYKREQRIRLSFAAFSGLTSLFLLSQTSQVRFIIQDFWLLFYIFGISSLLWPAAMLLFFESAVLKRSPLFRWLAASQVLYGLLAMLFLPVASVNLSNPIVEIVYSLMPILTVALYALLITGLSIRTILRSPDRIHRMVALSFLTLGLFGGRELLADFGYLPRERLYYHWGVLLSILFLGYTVEQAVDATGRELLESRARLDRASIELERARLDLLQERMNPHFLLNTFGVVYALLEKRSIRSAKQAVILISEHYRFLADRSYRSVIPFLEEWDFCKNYMEIQALRFGELSHRFTLRSGAWNDLSIPPLTIQPLIENAVQHGIRRISGPGKITIEARRIGHSGALIEIIDNGPGPAEEKKREETIQNILKRLRHYYETVEFSMTQHGRESGCAVEISFHTPRQHIA